MEEPGGGLLGVAHGDQVDVAAADEVEVAVGVFVNAYGKNNQARVIVVKLEQRG